MSTQDITRMLRAILSADVKDYSLMMGEDEVGTYQTLTAYLERIRSIISEHKGRVFSSPGDAVMAEFASVVDAVECAVELQENIEAASADVSEDRKMQFRIGVNLGDVIHDGEQVYGDGVNIAARIETLAEPGGVSISRNVYNQVRNKLKFGYEYQGKHQVKNIAEPVSVYKVLAAPEHAGQLIGEPKSPKRLSKQSYISIFAVLALVVAASIWQFYPRAPEIKPASAEKMAYPLPEKPSIAVLPFVNMSEDAEQEYFSDGITEDLITDLSKISELFVIARNSVFKYKSNPGQIRQVAEELGVRYVLEGSVRRAGDQVRINAQLIDAITGGHLWAERYDGKMENVFALQDRITQKIVLALKVKLTAGEEKQIARRGTDNTEAYEAFLKGFAHYRLKTPDDFERAIPYLEEAINKDPNYSSAYAALADVYWEIAKMGWKEWWDSPDDMSRAEILVKAEKYLREAMKDPTPLAHFVASDMRRGQGRHQDSITEATRALALDSGDPVGYLAMARALIWAGSPVEGADFIKKAMRLDPNYPPEYLHWLGVAQFGMERFEEATTTLEEAVRLSTYTETPLWLAATYGHLGRVQEAKQAIQTFSEHKAKSGWFFDATTSDFIDIWWLKEQADIERLRKGLGIAGVPAGHTYSNIGKDLISQTNEGPEVKGATTIDVTTAKALFDQGVPFVDARNWGHWSKGHIPGAVHLHEYTFREFDLSKVVSKDQEVVIYCDGYT